MRIASMLLAALLLAAPGGALSAVVAVPPPAPSDVPAAPPYEADLLRLSEILGAVHYLRQLCKADEGDVWRQQMEKLLETESPDEARRARMVDRFNRGYDSYKSVYVSCTPAATESTQRYLEEGAKIAAEITARYGK
jgi:uncharacterized protein (TIGR02301 family)